MIIRLMQKEDLPLILEAEQRLYLNPWNKEAYLQELEQNKFAYLFVLCEEGKIAGYYGFWLVDDYATVTKIGVLPEFQGHGLAKILVQDLLSRCQKAEVSSIDLEVRESNSKAIALYQEFNFKAVHIRKNYYPDGENAILMLKKLKEEDSYERIHLGN
ncbi:ribosomal protein S18-alanine N-acetyltransferase [bacterium]|jgi:ribosomal-protein-alanine N-acetyltransferase|nr:ribosomal protein S18-alanine N-acetyltransferase [bacterium]